MTVAQHTASPRQSSGSVISEAWEDVALPPATAGAENFMEEDEENEPQDMEQDQGAELRRRRVAQQGRSRTVMQGNIEREAIDLQGQAPTRAKERAQAASKSLASSSTSPSPMGLTTEELMLIAKMRENKRRRAPKRRPMRL